MPFFVWCVCVWSVYVLLLLWCSCGSYFILLCSFVLSSLLLLRFVCFCLCLCCLIVIYCASLFSVSCFSFSGRYDRVLCIVLFVCFFVVSLYVVFICWYRLFCFVLFFCFCIVVIRFLVVRFITCLLDCVVVPIVLVCVILYLCYWQKAEKTKTNKSQTENNEAKKGTN